MEMILFDTETQLKLKNKRLRQRRRQWRPVRRVKLAEQGNSLPGKRGRQEGPGGLKLGQRSEDNAAHNLILPIKRNH